MITHTPRRSAGAPVLVEVRTTYADGFRASLTVPSRLAGLAYRAARRRAGPGDFVQLFSGR